MITLMANVHKLTPYTIIRQTLKIGNVATMVNMVCMPPPFTSLPGSSIVLTSHDKTKCSLLDLTRILIDDEGNFGKDKCRIRDKLGRHDKESRYGDESLANVRL
jgi:hypothetical protein